MGSVWSNAAIQGDWQTGRCRSLVRVESSRTSPVSVTGKANRLTRGHRLSPANAATSPAPALSRCHGSSATTHLQENKSLHRSAHSPSCVLLAEILTRLESGRKSLEPLEASGTEIPPSQNERRTQTLDATQTQINGQTSAPHARPVLPLLRRRTIQVAHCYIFFRTGHNSPDERVKRPPARSHWLGDEDKDDDALNHGTHEALPPVWTAEPIDTHSERT
jgi:hypothetical protein